MSHASGYRNPRHRSHDVMSVLGEYRKLKSSRRTRSAADPSNFSARPLNSRFRTSAQNWSGVKVPFYDALRSPCDELSPLIRRYSVTFPLATEERTSDGIGGVVFLHVELASLLRLTPMAYPRSP